MFRRSVGRRAERERGAVAVETALVSLLLVTIVYGIIETSFLLRDWLSVSTSARSGARTASSEPRVNATGNVTAQVAYARDAAVQVANQMGSLDKTRVTKLWVYKANQTTGKPDSGNFTSCGKCVTFKYDAGSASFVVERADWLGSEQNACAADAAHDAVGVYVEYTHKAVMGGLFENRVVSESTVMSLEPIPATVQCRP